jgi:hypothetical protein
MEIKKEVINMITKIYFQAFTVVINNTYSLFDVCGLQVVTFIDAVNRLFSCYRNLIVNCAINFFLSFLSFFSQIRC